MIELLPIIGSIITMLLGLMGLLSPASAAKFTSIKPDGLVGVSEIRATYGGFFLGIGGAHCFFKTIISIWAWVSLGFRQRSEE